jgi:hypothetical protein
MSFMGGAVQSQMQPETIGKIEGFMTQPAARQSHRANASQARPRETA